MNKTKVGEYLTPKWLVVGVGWMCACFGASVGNSKENIDVFSRGVNDMSLCV